MKELYALLACMAFVPAVKAQYSSAQPIHRAPFQYLGNELPLFVDLDGDGLPEVLLHSEGQGLAFMRGLGNGKFGPVEWIDIGYDGYLFGRVVSDDLDGDGDSDIVLTNWEGPLRLLMNMGSADFMVVELPNPVTSSYAAIPSIADMDGDGDQDIVLVEYETQTGNAYLIPNLGAGNWGAAAVAATMPNGCDQFHLADVDGDAYPDIIFAEQNVYQPMVAINTGNGVCGAPQVIPGSGTERRLDDVSDADGDGDADILLNPITPDDQLVLLRNDGTGTFSTEILINTWDATASGRFADLDGDGDLDIVADSYINNTNDQWLVNDGNGVFGTMLAMPSGVYGTMTADVDGDQLIDLFSISDQLLAWRNQGAAVFGPMEVIIGSASDATGMSVADFNGDGHVDVMVKKGNGPFLHVNLGNGQFAPQSATGLDSRYTSTTLDPTDLDGDGDLDVVLDRLDSIRVALNDGTGRFTIAQVIPYLPTTYNYQVLLADLNGDHIADLVRRRLTDEWDVQLNDGTGNFGASILSPASAATYPIICMDMDGDGDLDLMDYDTNLGITMNWYANDGFGNFSAGGTVPVDNGLLYSNTVANADLDGNGTMDLIYLSGMPELVVQLNAGGGVFGAAQVVVPTNEFITNAILGDADGDGDTDILVAYSEPKMVEWYLNDGVGNFSQGAVLDDTFNDVPKFLATADIDGDGREDAVVLSGSTDSWENPLVSRIDWYEQFSSAPFAINGTVYMDVDGNGVQDAGDEGLPLLQPISTPIGSVAFTDANGDYSIAADEEAVYQVQFTSPGPLWQLSTPAVLTPSVDAGTPVSNDNDFGLQPVSITTDLLLSAVISSAPCFGEVTHFLSVLNQGTTQPSGTICYTIDPLFTYVSSDPAPTNINGNTLCWAYADLGYFAQVDIVVQLTSPSWTSTGAPLNFTLTATEEDGGGGVVQTFTANEAETVSCPYDPNDKKVEPEGYGDAGAIDIDTEWLDYRIRFQNTGTAPAADVTLTDRLDEAIDIASLQVIGYSHEPTSVSIEEDRKLVIHFTGIQLPDSGANNSGSQGYFRFRVKLMPGAAHGTLIENTALIFFDNNPAVVTNTTSTTLVDCELWAVSITQPQWNLLQATEGDAYQWFIDGTAIDGATGPQIMLTANGEYTVEVTSEFGCVTTSEPFTVLTTDLASAGTLAMGVMPNPFDDHTDILFSERISAGSVLDLLDMNGRIVRSLSVSGTRRVTMDRSDLVEGLYTLRLVTPEGELAMTKLAIVAGPH